MQEKSTIKQNILKYLDIKSITPYKFYQETGITRGILTQNNGMSEENTSRFLAYFPEVNAHWLFTGEGSMLKGKTEDEKVKHLIPLYDGVMSAGTFSVADLSPSNEPAEMIDAGDWFRDATAAMRVHGDSMYPDYHSGSIVAVKEVYNKRLIVFGQDYLIETSEYRILKRLQKSTEKHNWLACSTNQEVWESGEMKGRLIHEPFDIHIDDVGRLFQVLGSVKRNQSSRIIPV